MSLLPENAELGKIEKWNPWVTYFKIRKIEEMIRESYLSDKFRHNYLQAYQIRSKKIKVFKIELKNTMKFLRKRL